MDSQSQGTFEAMGFSRAYGPTDSDYVADHSIPSAACNLCGTIFSSANEGTADLENMGLCGDCKFLLLEDFGTPTRNSYWSESARRRVRTRHSSAESIEILFSQQFTHMINVARQSLSPAPGGYDDQAADGYAVARLTDRSGLRVIPSDSRRWRRVLSDTESEDFDHFDSRYGESDSNASFSQYRFFHGDSDAVSFSAYGEESDAASVDVHSFLDPEIFVQPDERSNFDFDTDIDPMHAGLNQWNSLSDDQEEDEDEGEWEEADPEEYTPVSRLTRARLGNYLTSPIESNGPMTRTRSFDSPDFEGMLRLRIRQSRLVLPRNILTGLDDSVDEMDFEAMLEHLAETDDSRRGAPPTAESFVRNLPRMTIKQEHLKHNYGLDCAICKDLLTIGTEVNQLPCLHLYHPRCIFPWLSARNSCPLCRYELPTDDKDYEERKRNSNDGIQIRGIPDRESEDSSDDADVSEMEGDESAETNLIITERDRFVASGAQGRGMWFFLAAAPVVSLAGVILVVWFSNSQRRGLPIPHNLHQIQNQRGCRARRWWPFF